MVVVSSLTEEQHEEAVEMALSFYDVNGRMDWDDFFYRVEKMLDIDLPVSMDNPLLKEMRRRVNQARREARF